ncbi:MAG TPA: prolipoprotein diacylglyceryl transferase family protein, partial [Oxalicibacterium sp.]|nr:prolipoprotein diacylglyceryl transferase family protein [Oxalicibacterium sp.]
METMRRDIETPLQAFARQFRASRMALLGALVLLLAIAAAIWLTGRRWVKWGGDWDLIFRMAVWVVIAGIVGARIYHLITNWEDPAIH